MRILDLGAHDGFVGTWLARQVDGLHIDGVEANSDAVRRANKRAKEHDISGSYIQGLAEDAPDIFETESYDTVVAFELIEHVPDVDLFLDRAEEMLKPGGRVYLSTPDGTFGEGNNPHHLRAYRAVDLFELCRRRGRICDMVAGSDGVTVISYEPSNERRPELAIFCGPGWEKWHPSDIATKGLGGSETAAIKLAEALSDYYTVTVYGECDYCAWRQVSFKPHHTFDPLEPREALIISRMPSMADRCMRARTKMLWMHDTEYGKDLMSKERMKKFDSVLVLSEWHKEFIAANYALQMDVDKLTVFGNAIEPRYFRGEVRNPRLPIALYTSSPDRGLDLVLRLWPRVRAELPEAELHFAYASVYHTIAAKDPTVAAFRAEVLRLADQPGVVDLGSLTQPELAKKMQEVSVWLAPSISTAQGALFHETYCIGAQEAAAGGAVIIASAWGALPERAEQATNSILIPNTDWASKEWEDEWVASIVNGMKYPICQPSNLALTTTWAVRALQIKELIESAIPTPV